MCHSCVLQYVRSVRRPTKQAGCKSGCITDLTVSPTFYSWCAKLPTFLHYFYSRVIYYMSSYKADVRSANWGFWQQPTHLTWPGAR